MAAKWCTDEVSTMKWKWFCHSLRVDRRKGRKYLHTYIHELFHVATVISLNTAHTLEECGAGCFYFRFIFRITFLVFLLFSLHSVFKSLNIYDSSQVPHSYPPFSIYFERHLLPNCISWIIIFPWNVFSRSKKKLLSSNIYEYCLFEIFVQTLYFDFLKNVLPPKYLINP
jgi:hypothetical protein